MSSKKIIYLVLSIVAIVLVGYFVATKVANQQKTVNNNQVACTMEAKICPDGSSVGRSGPKCEFAPCPEIANHADWQTYKDPQQKFEFQYPQEIGTQYITKQDWPPQVQVLDKPFTCTTGGLEISQAGKTSQEVINNHVYCVTKESEGAAGSVYTNYAYAFAQENQTVIFTFTLRAVQCANYDNPQKTACEQERASFNVANLADQIVSTLVFTTDTASQNKPIVSFPQPNDKISSPLIVSGEARGTWFFEASFPVQLVDVEGNILVQGIAQAKADWMTENFIPFQAELAFTKPVGQTVGYLILKKDNPSGLPEHDDELKIPVIF